MFQHDLYIYKDISLRLAIYQDFALPSDSTQEKHGPDTVVKVKSLAYAQKSSKAFILYIMVS